MGRIFFLFWRPQGIWSSPHLGSDLNHSCNLGHRCDLHLSCDNARSFTPLCLARDGICVLVLQRHLQSLCATVGAPIQRHFKLQRVQKLVWLARQDFLNILFNKNINQHKVHSGCAKFSGITYLRCSQGNNRIKVQ